MQRTDLKVLLVDDDGVDAMAIQRAFRKRDLPEPTVARDGLEALSVLRGADGMSRLPRPYVVLLDLNMPRMGGLEFLEHVRSDPDLHDVVVFVLTTSDAESDRTAAYEKNVAGYIVKSDVGHRYLDVARLIEDYWSVVELP